MSSSLDDNTNDWAAIKRYVGLLIGLVVVVVVWKTTASNSKPASTADQKAGVNPVPTGDNTASVVLQSIGSKALTEDQARPVLEAWLRKAWQANGLEPSSPALSAEAWQRFAKAAISFELRAPDALSHKEIKEMAVELLPVAGSHPVSAYVVGKLLFDHPSSESLLAKAVKGLADQKGAEVIAFHAAAALAETVSQEDVAKIAKTRVADAMKALRKALDAEEGFAGMPDRLSSFLLMSGTARALFDDVHDLYWAEVAKTPKMKPWLSKWIEGAHLLASGWEARGGGYANTVSDNGMNRFHRESLKASKLFQEAWDLKPEDPGPAISATYAAISIPSTAKGEMQRWFTQLLQYQVDSTDAVHNVLWGLHKRWYGSHEEMVEFGTECLKSGRFDSALPWALLEAHRECAAEWDVPDAYFKEMMGVCADNVHALFEGAEKDPKRAAWKSVDRTHAAVFNFKCGKYDEAQAWLKKLDFKPNKRALEEWGDVDTALLVGKSAAFAGENGGKLRQAEVASLAFNTSGATEMYREALTAVTGKISDAGRSYIDERLLVSDWETKLRTVEGVSLMPDEKFQGWSRKGGGWKRVDGALEHHGLHSVQSTTCEVRTGLVFTAESEIEITDPEKLTQVWIGLGFPEHQSGDRWIAVRLACRKDKAVALLSDGLGEPVEKQDIDSSPKYKLTINANPDGLTLKVNDKKVFDHVPMPSDYVKDDFSLLGIGAMTQSEQTRVKIRSLRVHQ